MWIRSQDKKTLVNADRICMKHSFSYEIYQQDENGTITLGKYSTEEKAMKVMDMIQKQIVFCSERYEIVRAVLRSDCFEPYWKKCEVVIQLPDDDEVKE